jgi:hypothetical protein
VKWIPQAGLLEQVFRQYKVPGKQMEEMAILKNMTLKDEIPAG